MSEPSTAQQLTVEEVAARLRVAIASAATSGSEYARKHDLPYLALTRLLATGQCGDEATYGPLYDHACTLPATPTESVPAEAKPEANEEAAPADALAMAHAELDQLREELTIYKERVEGEKAILLRIRTAEAKVESAKMALSSEKERLSQAHDELAAFIAQEPGKQQEIPFGKDEPVNDGSMTWFEQGASAFNQGRPLDACALPLGENRVAWERGWRGARVDRCGGGCITSAMLGESIGLIENLADELPVGEKPVTVDTVEHLDRSWIVYRGDDKPAGSRHVIIPLYSKDEWNQLHADTYGNPVAGFDQDNGARDRRQKGGIDCGRVVKIGRKSLVVGPLTDACWVEVKTAEAEEA